MKNIIAALLSLSLLFAMAGCTQQGSDNPGQQTAGGGETPPVQSVDSGSETPVTVDFWHAITGENEAVLQKLVDEFNAQSNGKIQVNLVYQGKYKELFSKLEGAAKAGELPTLSMIYNNRLTAYIMSDMVEDLTPYINDPEKGFSQEVWENIPAFMTESSVWDGKQYSLPFNKAAYLLFYNQDLLDEYGVEVPTNWDELAAAAEKLTVTTEDGKQIVGLALNQSVGTDSSFWVEQAGGHLYDEATDEILFNQQPGVDAYTFLTDMIKAGHAKICTEESYIIGPFGRGEAAMGITWMEHLPDITATCQENGVNWGTAVLPAGERSATLFTGTNIAMFNTSSQEQKDAAFAFLKFFLEAENQFTWGTESGFLPLNNEVLLSEEYQSYCEENSPAKLTAIGAYEGGFADPKILNGYAIHDNMSKALDKILLEGMDVKEALDQAAEQARKEIDQARTSFEAY